MYARDGQTMTDLKSGGIHENVAKGYATDGCVPTFITSYTYVPLTFPCVIVECSTS